MREESDNLRPNGGWLHKLGDDHRGDWPLPAKSQPKESKATFTTANEAAQHLAKSMGRVADQRWYYRDADGEPIGVVLRWNKGDGSKEIRPLAKLNGRWTVAAMPAPRPLYQLPDLRAAELVVIVEGEKSADAVRSLGMTATTSAGGSSAAKQTDWAPLAGKQSVILPDNDEPGRKYAKHVLQLLDKLTPAPVVKVVVLPDLPEAGDVVDWIDNHGDAAEPETLRDNLLQLIRSKAPEVVIRDEQLLGRPSIVRLSDVAPQPVDWLWPGRIAIGKLTLLAGDPGLGKSFISCDLAAKVSTGAPWPDAPDSRRSPGGVVLMNAEDDAADTLRPRLDAHGADVQRIVALEAIIDHDAQGELPRGVDLSRDLAALEEAIDQAGECRLVVVDPVSAYLGRTDSHSNTEVRGVLERLADLANRKRVALLAVTHLRKGEGPAVYRAMGSLAFIAAARSAWAVCKDESDPRRRLVLPMKNNIAPDVQGLAYSIEPLGEGGQPCVVWESAPVTVTADQAMGNSGRRGPVATAADDAADWLRDELADGPRPAPELYSLAQEEGISAKALRSGFTKIGGEKRKVGMHGGWWWALPGGFEGFAVDDQDPAEGTPTEITRASSGKLGHLRVKPEEYCDKKLGHLQQNHEDAQVSEKDIFGESSPGEVLEI